MTHLEAFNQITEAMKYLDTSLADKEGVLNAHIRIKFFRDPDTNQLTQCAIDQSFQIQST